MKQLKEALSGVESEAEAEAVIDAVLVAMKEAIPESARESATKVADAMDKRAKRFVGRAKRSDAGFRSRLEATWREPFSRLRVLVQAFQEFGEAYHEGTGHPDAEPPKCLTSALTQLHVRACRTAREVMHLLEGGFADGALARWRTLHEVAVVAAFLQQHGEDAAELYLLHDQVRACRIAEMFAANSGKLGWEPVPHPDLTHLRSLRDELCVRFGKPFSTEYGWAAVTLRVGNPGFRQIEEVVDLAIWRPFYRWASDGVHAGPGGLRPLGVHRDAGLTLLAGPSNIGLADPGQNTCLSLGLIVSALTIHRPTLDAVSSSMAFQELATRCVSAFVRVSVEFDEEVGSR